jgi:hypothetical protein
MSIIYLTAMFQANHHVANRKMPLYPKVLFVI